MLLLCGSRSVLIFSHTANVPNHNGPQIRKIVKFS